MNVQQKELAFKADISAAIARAIAHLPDGTVGVGQECLWNMIVGEVARSRWAPVGTNAGWVAHEAYLEVVTRPLYAKFVYDERNHQ